MFPTIKSAFSKVCSREINGKAWGTISREFEDNVRPTLRAAIKAYLPGHDADYIDYQTDYMIRNTVDHMVLTWDENLAGRGGVCADWSIKRWAKHRREVGECDVDYLKRTGIKKKIFQYLKERGDIVRMTNGKLNIKYLVEEIHIRQEQEDYNSNTNNNEYEYNETNKNKKTILSKILTNDDYFPLFDDQIVLDIEIQPPTPPPKSCLDMSQKELYAIFGL